MESVIPCEPNGSRDLLTVVDRSSTSGSLPRFLPQCATLSLPLTCSNSYSQQTGCTMTFLITLGSLFHFTAEWSSSTVALGDGQRDWCATLRSQANGGLPIHLLSMRYGNIWPTLSRLRILNPIISFAFSQMHGRSLWHRS